MKRPHKYGAKAVEVDGHKFPSTKEARRYGELKLLERAGQIADLKLQPRFPMIVNEKLITTYVADFTYREGETSIVEDAKGFQTDTFKIKRKLFEALYPFELRVT